MPEKPAVIHAVIQIDFRAPHDAPKRPAARAAVLAVHGHRPRCDRGPGGLLAGAESKAAELLAAYVLANLIPSILMGANMGATPRDSIPDQEVRARLMASFSVAYVLPLADVALFLDLPLSTLDKLRGEGKGPKCFRLGRRLYVLQTDLRAWLDAMAKSEADSEGANKLKSVESVRPPDSKIPPTKAIAPKRPDGFDDLPDSAYVRIATVKMLFACSAVTVWRWSKNGKLPTPRKLGPRLSAWNVGELRRALNKIS